ncbi:hypothetical protein D3C71_1442010 [compost metagenome]
MRHRPHGAPAAYRARGMKTSNSRLPPRRDAIARSRPADLLPCATPCWPRAFGHWRQQAVQTAHCLPSSGPASTMALRATGAPRIRTAQRSRKPESVRLDSEHSQAHAPAARPARHPNGTKTLVPDAATANGPPCAEPPPHEARVTKQGQQRANGPKQRDQWWEGAQRTWQYTRTREYIDSCFSMVCQGFRAGCMQWRATFPASVLSAMPGHRSGSAMPAWRVSHNRPPGASAVRCTCLRAWRYAEPVCAGLRASTLAWQPWTTPSHGPMYWRTSSSGRTPGWPARCQSCCAAPLG